MAWTMSKNYFTEKELEHFKKQLIEKRHETAQSAQRLREIAERQSAESDETGDLSSIPTHLADLGTDAHEQEINLEMMEYEMKLLEEIDQAIARIEDGTYGLCQGTGKPISKERLEAEPWARYSIEYKRELEASGPTGL